MLSVLAVLFTHPRQFYPETPMTSHLDPSLRAAEALQRVREMRDAIIVASSGMQGPWDACVCLGCFAGTIANIVGRKFIAKYSHDALATIVDDHSLSDESIEAYIELSAFTSALARRESIIVPAQMLYRVMLSMGVNDETWHGTVMEHTYDSSSMWTEPYIMFESAFCYATLNRSAFDTVVASLPQDENWFRHVGSLLLVLPSETLRAVTYIGYPSKDAMCARAYADAAKAMNTQEQRTALYTILSAFMKVLNAGTAQVAQPNDQHNDQHSKQTI